VIVEPVSVVSVGVTVDPVSEVTAGVIVDPESDEPVSLGNTVTIVSGAELSLPHATSTVVESANNTYLVVCFITPNSLLKMTSSLP